MPDYSQTRIQFRRGTASELNAANPILGKGEPAFAIDTNSLKVGDGSTAYISLSSISGGGEGGGSLDSVVQDTTPQLGGTLDALSNNISSVGIITATSFVKSGGTSSQFLKADGSIDTSTYLTSISNIDTTNFNSSAIVTESEGISSNDNDTTIPTSAAVKDYVDNSGGASLSQEDVEDYVGDMLDGGTETGISVTYDDDNGKIDFVVASQTDENFTTDDHSKLDGIEAGADVTDTDNVTSAGALMDSEVTNLSQVKAFDSSAYATATQGTKADSAQQPPSEGAFANGDKTKLDGIETSADVTDTDNVTSAGALMDSEVTNLTEVKAFDSSDYATAAQGAKADTAQQPPSEGAFADGDKTKLNSIEASADVTDTANVTSAGALMDSELASIANVKALDQSVIAGASPNLITTNMTDASDKRFMTDAQEAKLDSVESNADVTDTANVTSAGALMDSELASIANVKALDQSVVAGSAPNFLTTNMSDAANKRLMTDAQESKLDSVETSADVTDTTNVVAALSSGTGVSISAGGVISVSSLALTTVQTASDETAHLALTAQEGDVVVRSDEDKSYVHNGGSAGTMSDYTLLLTPTDAVLSVAGNTGAVTAAQIKTAYEGESDTNAFTDADHSKLDGIEASADITDTANVTAAGALMDSEITNLAQVKAFDSSDYLASETFTSVVQDTTPQLGGNLDLNGKAIEGAAVFNETGASVDFRIEGDTEENLLFVDASTNRIGIATDSPSHKLSIADSTLLGGILVSGGGTPGLSLIDTTDDSSHGVYGSDNGILLVSADITSVGGSSSAIKLGVQNATQATITSSGIGIGTETPQHKLDVVGMGRFVHADGSCGLQVEDTGGSGIHIGDCALGSVTAYAGMKHSNHGASDYMMISNGVTTFLSAVDNGAVVIRGGGNDSANEIQIKDVGAGVAGIIFNEGGADRDIRMEGDTEENLFYVDASTNRIGIGTAAPDQTFDVSTVQSEIAGFNGLTASSPVASGNLQSLIIEAQSGAGAKGVYLKHMCNESNGSSTLSMKNVLRMGEGIISFDDAYTSGLGTTYYPKLQVNTDTGAVTFADAFTFPTADGSASQILQTDGAGNVTWEDAASGGGISNVVEDTTPQLGGDLDANGNDIDMGTNVITDAKVGYWVPSNTSAVSNSTQVTNLVMITQSNYDALGSYDSNTLYFIT